MVRHRVWPKRPSVTSQLKQTKDELLAAKEMLQKLLARNHDLAASNEQLLVSLRRLVDAYHELSVSRRVDQDVYASIYAARVAIEAVHERKLPIVQPPKETT